MEFDFTLTGRTSLLMSADNIEAADELAKWLEDPDNKKMSKRGDDRTPAWGWMIRIHHDGARFAIPQDVIMAMLREAGKKVTMSGKKTFKSETQSNLLIADEFCQLKASGKIVKMSDIQAIRNESFAKQSEAVQKMGFRLYCKRASIGSSKHVRVRPRFDAWEVSGRIEVFGEAITEDVLNTLFRIGGSKCGLLDWRPNADSPGPFGQFDHKLVRVA